MRRKIFACALLSAGLLWAGTGQAQTIQDTLEVPFTEHFTQASFNANWTITDANEDEETWEFVDYYGIDDTANGRGAARYRYSPSERADDYLVSIPAALPAGDISISFYYSTVSEYSTESFSVLLGSSPETSQMDTLAVFTDIASVDEWTFVPLNIRIENEGTYYLAFHCFSEADQMGLLIDEVSINAGRYIGTPDLCLDEILFPSRYCELDTNETIGLRVTNNGSEASYGFRVDYALDDGEWKQESFTDTIAMNQTKEVYLSQAFNLSGYRKYYFHAKAISLNTVNPETDTLDNFLADSIETRAALTVPYIDPVNGDWASDGLIQLTSDSTYQIMQAGKMLQSRCFLLEAGEYRLSYEIMAGTNYYVVFEDSYSVLVGNSFSPAGQWEEIHSETDLYTTESYVSREISFPIETPGYYSIAFRPADDPDNLCIGNITLAAKTGGGDARISNWSLEWARQTPAGQLTHPSLSTVEVENRGMAVQARLSVEQGESTLWTSESFSLEELAIDTLQVQVPALNPVLGETLEIELALNLEDETDLFPDDNRISLATLVHDSTLAYDNIPDEWYSEDGIGAYAPISIGMPIYLSAADTITSLTLGVAPVALPIEFGLYLFESDPGYTFGESVFGGMVTRGSTEGWYTYSFPPRILQPGWYVIGVTQYTAEPIFLWSDDTEEGITLQYADTGTMILTGFGYPCLRANFGHPQLAQGLDVAAAEFVSPADSGFYRVDETIAATIENKGLTTVYDVPVHMAIGKTEQTLVIDSIAAYATATARFTAEMELPGEYSVLLYTTLEGDQNPSNDSIRKVFVCLDSVSNQQIVQLKNEISLYPNPAKDECRISSVSASLTDLHVYDMHGKEVLREENLQATEYVLKLQNWEKGVYIVHIMTSKGSLMKKLIVQ